MKSIFTILFTVVCLTAQLAGAQPVSQDNAPKRVRVGGNVMAVNLITKVTPVYPAEMKAQRLEGTVQLQATISADGVPQSLNVQNADVDRAFVDAAIEAVKQWRYKPVLLNGEPVEVITTITVNFTLSQ
jgi:protein TonB